MTPEQALNRAQRIDPEQIREAAADARALAIEELAVQVGPSEASRQLALSPSAVTKARARVREINADAKREDRLTRAATIAAQLGV